MGNKPKGWADYLSNKRQKFDVILIAVLVSVRFCTISIGRAIGGMGFVRCTEVSESPLLEVSLYYALCL